MSNTAQRTTQIRRSIELLTQVTQNAQLRDQSATIEAQRQFQTLRDEMAHSEHPAMVLLASVAERMCGQIYRDEQLSGEEMKKFVIEIAEHITKELAIKREVKPALGGASLSMTSSEMKLALRDGQRLGELLVKMTMLTDEQVQEALHVQRATGQRLGEALLQLRLLTPDMLESALRVQKTKRVSGSKADAWSKYKGPAA